MGRRGREWLHTFFRGKRRPHSVRVEPMKLTAAERERLARMRARPCKHGHLRHDARVYRKRQAPFGSTACNAFAIG